MNLCLEFQEAYKRLDKLCKDCFQSNDGVSEYIRQMEYVMKAGEANIPNWVKYYKMLKHVRHVRNRLSHDVGTLTSDVCTENDYKLVLYFYDEMMKMRDPLTVYYTDIQPRIGNCVQKNSLEQKYTDEQTSHYRNNDGKLFVGYVSEKEEKKSGLKKFFDKIKDFFG